MGDPAVEDIFIGQGLLPIGTGHVYPLSEIMAGNLVSPFGTVSIGYMFPNITLDVTGASDNWNFISADQALVNNQNYVCISPGGALQLALPAISLRGSLIEVALNGATSFTITQGALQSIVVGAFSTTPGVTGSLTTTAQGDTVRMICVVTNLTWFCLSMMGNPTLM